MRRVMLLALLTMALPIAAMANVILTTGPFVSGLVALESGGGLTHPMFDVGVNGSVNHIALRTSGLSSGCVASGGTCTFSSATITVTSALGPSVFSGTVSGGTITNTSTSAVIEATLVPSAMTESLGLGPGVFFNVAFSSTMPISDSLLGGTAAVGTPEPGTLCLLGTSVIGLAGMARRRLKLGK